MAQGITKSAGQSGQLANFEEIELTKKRANNSWHGRALLALVAVAVLFLAGSASAQDTELTFKGAIGVIPVTGVGANNTVNLNVVRGVPPGAPWRIAGLTAEVDSDGHIKVEGRGLLLASGNGIGTNGGQTVHATLFCGAAASATAHNSPAVALEDNGNFTIDGFLDSTPESPCVSPVLLIRNTGGVWFAAGILKLGDTADKN